MQLRILNKKEISRILNKVKAQFGINDIKFNYGMLQNKEGKIFFITSSLNKVDLNKLRINELGLYVIKDDKEIRLTIEGSQIFGEYATKNVLEVDEDDAYGWMSGNKIKCDKVYNGFVIIKHKDNYLGSGKYKEGVILNYIPKERWIK